MATFNLAPIPRWLFTDLSGNILSNGKMYTFEDLDHSVYKPVYQDPEGQIPWPQPVPFGLNGMAGPFYWKDDSNYFLQILDRNNVPQFTVSGYNAPSSSTPPTPGTSSITNLARNPQFTYWTNGKTLTNYKSSINPLSDFTADDWSFVRSNLNATINISAQPFLLGQIDVDGSPVYYLRYECTTAGAGGETFKYFAQEYKSVQTLAGKEVSVYVVAKTDTGSAGTIQVRLGQYFGSGGTPSATVMTVIIPTATLSTNFSTFIGTVTLPSIAGKTLGNNGDDSLFIAIDTPLNQPAIVDISNVLIKEGTITSDTPFPYETVDDQYKKIDSLVNYATWYTGDIKSTIRTTADPGWLMMDDTTIGSPSSGASHAFFGVLNLYVHMWNINNLYCPIFNSDGTIGTRGASALADFNANKRLMMLKMAGRVIAGTGPAVIHNMFTATPGTPGILTVSTGLTEITPSMVVQFTTTGTLPGGLSLATNYYLTAINSTEYRVSTSYTNLINGVYVTITNAGTGTHTMSTTLLDGVLGQTIGQTSVLLFPGNMPGKIVSVDESIPTVSVYSDDSDGTLNVPFEIIQPTTFLNYMIKL